MSVVTKWYIYYNEVIVRYLNLITSGKFGQISASTIAYFIFIFAVVLGKLYQCGHEGNPHHVEERHRHRYEVNPERVSDLEKAGMMFVGHSTDDTRMEIMELKGKREVLVRVPYCQMVSSTCLIFALCICIQKVNYNTLFGIYSIACSES